MRSNCRLICLFALLTFPLRPYAGDLSCDVYEKERQKQAWFYDLPAAASLPPLAAVVSAGAFIVLDEIAKGPNGCAVSFIAVAGDKKSIDLLANFEVSAGFASHALIKGRLRRPDGTAAELQAADIHCQAITSDNRGYFVGRENEAKGYVAHFQGVTPGTLIQTQVHSVVSGLIEPGKLKSQ